MASVKHLVGQIMFRDVVNHVMIGGALEIYADDKKAIIWVRNLAEPERSQRSIYRRPLVVSTLHNVICLIREVLGPSVDMGKERVDAVVCWVCRGSGWYVDSDGNRPDCRHCHGQGWVE